MASKFYSVGDTLTCPHITAFDGITKLMVSYWMRLPDRDDSIHVGQINSGQTQGWAMGMGSGVSQARLLIRNTYNHGSTTGPGAYIDWENPTVWHHYMAVLDIPTYVNGHAKFYLDGAFVIEGAGGDQWNSTLGTHTDPFQIGGVSNTAWADVEIAEVSVWAGHVDTAYPALLGAGASPMAMAVQPTFYARLKTDASTLTGQTLTVNGGAAFVADTLTVDDPPSGGSGSMHRVLWTGSKVLLKTGGGALSL